jgi:hypothetical protein
MLFFGTARLPSTTKPTIDFRTCIHSLKNAAAAVDTGSSFDAQVAIMLY